MSYFTTLARNIARNADYAAATRAPLDIDGALPRTHITETKVTQILDLFVHPPITLGDLPAFWDAIRHANSIDDRKMLLEKLLVTMARFKDHEISLTIQQAAISLLYKDLPHPPKGFLRPFDVSKALYLSSQPDAHTPPTMPKHVDYAYRAPDGSNYNPLIPGIGKAGSPYARSVPSTNLTPTTTLPDPHLIFDTLLKRDKFTPHPDGISSLFFAFADLVIHCIFDTNRDDWKINDTSSYLDLSVLYGNSDKQMNNIRSLDGTGKLKPDCFADSRLLMMPPASCALLVLLNRNHNYIAQRILEINECQRFRDPSTLSPDAKTIQDDEIFHRTRLVNCGYFMHIILGDYVGAILGLVRDGSSWRLDPLMNMRDSNHEIAIRGEGNVVSIEFNLLYRWHSTLSQQNVAWVEEKLGKLLPKDINAATIPAFKNEAKRLEAKTDKIPPWEWTFGGKSRVDGRFKDTDLAEIIQGATNDVAGAFKARGIPECMRAVEILGIMRSRQWGTCSLNEFRKFMGLKPYKDFKEWNPDPTIHDAAAALYRNIDRLELYVGLQAEEAKTPQPGAGLCPGYTISRAILADAVCLTRGDRFLTTDFTPFNLTAWGYQDCQYDKEDGSYGGLLTKLLFRTLPDHYPAGSALAHFPFIIPGKMYSTLKARNDGSLGKYRWPAELDNVKPLSPLQSHEWKVVDDLESVRRVLTTDAAKFPSAVASRQEIVVESVLADNKGNKSKAQQAVRNGQARVTELITTGGNWVEYFQKKTELLMKKKAFDQVGSDEVRYVDIVKDVIDLLPVHWICEKIAGLPLKSFCNPEGAWREQETCDKFDDIARYIYLNFDPDNDYKLRERSQNCAKEVIHTITELLDRTESRFASPANLSHLLQVSEKYNSTGFLQSLRRSSGGGGSAHTVLATNVFNATIPTAALFSKAVAQTVDYFLADENRQARGDIVDIFLSKQNNASAIIMGYVREALRLNPIFAGVYRTAVQTINLHNQRIERNDWVFVDIAKANESLGKTPDYSRPADRAGILSPHQDGMLTPRFFDTVVPVIVGTILSQRGLKRVDGESGQLTKFDDTWHGTKRRQYVNVSGLVTPWPDAMIVQFQPTA